MKKILHIASCAKFIPPFIGYIKENFNFEQHEFLLTSELADAELQNDKNVQLFSFNTFVSRIIYYFILVIKMHRADKIILHGLFNQRLVQVLFFSPWLLKKCYWLIWGGDLYSHQLGLRNWKWQIKEFFRRPVIKNIGHLVTYVEGDVELARRWYGAQGTYHECLMYQSNLYKEHELPERKSDTINIQIGNSADPINNHIEVLEKLLPYKNEDIRIHLPLSYGSSEYAKEIALQGRQWFGDKFNAITELMPFKDYLKFLSAIDIAFFNHKRQQAMGNTITLLGLGKTVYLRSDTTQWKFFKEKNIKIEDVDCFKSLNLKCNNENIINIKKYFCEERYHQQLAELFG